jgi:hypothetical protein
LKQLVEDAEIRTLAARAEEARAIAEVLDAQVKSRHAELEAAREVLSSAGFERRLQSLAEELFSERGGTPAAFHRLWQETYSTVVNDFLRPERG